MYKESDLSEAKYPPSTHLSAKKFYDIAIYLNDLLFTADILDEQYQRDMMLVSKETANGMNAIYIAEIIFPSEFE